MKHVLVRHNILTNELALYKNFGKILFSQRILILPKLTVKQECIPVGCVSPALYRTGWCGGWAEGAGVSMDRPPSADSVKY